MRPLSQLPQFPKPQILSKLIPYFQNPQFVALLNKANSNYYHWEELRRRPTPEGLSPEEFWTGVKLSRGARKLLPLVDPKNKPFSYWLPDKAVQILHVVDRQGGGIMAADIDGSDLFGQIKERVLIDSLMDEAIATSQIEGAVTTRKVAKELLRTGRKPRDKSEQMIINGYRTVRLLRDRIDKPLSIGLLHEIHESMTRDTLDDISDTGHFRNESDNVRIVDDRDGEVVFTPPPAAEFPLNHVWNRRPTVFWDEVARRKRQI